MIRILSIDGGGIRGIISATVLAYIEAKAKKPIHELFDVIGGSSTGGIISLGLNTQSTETGRIFSASDLLQFYTQDGDKIFCPRNISAQETQLIEHLLNLVDEADNPFFTSEELTGSSSRLLGPQYSAHCIESFFKEKFGTELTMSKLPTNCKVLVTGYDLQNNRPHYFTSWGGDNGTDDDYLVWQAARATSAARTHFPAARFSQKPNSPVFIDGSVFAFNPSKFLLSKAKRLYPKEDLMLISLGSGHYIRSIPAEKASNWGMMQWMLSTGGGLLSEVIMNGIAMAANEHKTTLLPNNSEGYPMYERFQIKLPRLSAMDDITPENISFLVEMGNKLVTDNKGRFEQVINRLIR